MTTVHMLSLSLVRLTLRKPICPNMLGFAVTSHYQPSLNHDGTKIFGFYKILDTSNRWQ